MKKLMQKFEVEITRFFSAQRVSESNKCIWVTTHKKNARKAVYEEPDCERTKTCMLKKVFLWLGRFSRMLKNRLMDFKVFHGKYV